MPHGSGGKENVKNTGSEKLKCHQPAVGADVLLLRNTCGAFPEASNPGTEGANLYAVGVGHRPQ